MSGGIASDVAFPFPARAASLPGMFGLDPWQFWTIFAVTAFAGFVKGAIGFAMPLIMASAFASILPPQVALAALILPVLTTNVHQSLRQGPAAAIQSIRNFRWHIGMVLVFLMLSAGLARQIPQGLMYALLGLPILAFALWQLAGRPMTLPIHHRRRAEVATGIVGGLYGGVSGIWGPPLVVLLLSLGVPKQEQVRVQGVVFLLGAAGLTAAHLASGILNTQTIPLSAVLCIPAFAGMLAGFALQDRMDVAQFRRWTLILLVITGLNLVRRALSDWI